MENKRCFVQFMHPGGEHKPDGMTPTGEAMKDWNTGEHKRKFLCNRGEYLTEPGASPQTDDLVFWAEWEPPSTVMHYTDGAVPDRPRYVYHPYYIAPPENIIVRNSDPFVFGDRFLYSNCQHMTKRGPTRMRYLDRGSVLLFGSYKKKPGFVLDTVFVVDCWVDYDLLDYNDTLDRKITETFENVTLATLKHEAEEAAKTEPMRNPNVSLRLYYGATPQHPVDGMFSFFPCRPYAEGDKGFARPTIRMEGKITDTLTQSRKCTYEANPDKVCSWWKDAVNQVLAKGLHLGVRTRLPPYTKASGKRPAPRGKGRRSC